MSPEYALISAQNAKNVSGYSSIRQECCKIDLCAAGAPIEPDSMLSQSGKSTKQKRKGVDYCIRQESKAGVKRRDITMRTNIYLNHFRRIAGAREGQTCSAPESFDASFQWAFRRA